MRTVRLLLTASSLVAIPLQADAGGLKPFQTRFEPRNSGAPAELKPITITGRWDWEPAPVSGGFRGTTAREDFWERAESSPGATEQETADKQGEPSCGQETSGNPVVLYTGNKVEPELDFAAAGEMGLLLQRTYNHFWTGTGLFGKHWLSNFDYSLAFSNGVAWAQRPDGRRIKFLADGPNRWNEDRAQPVASIVRNSDGTYTLHNEERGTETYDAEGYILGRRSEQGVRWTFSYSGKYLQQVTHDSGRHVRFGWSNGQLERVTDPAGNVYRYAYTPNVFGAGRGRLAAATLPGVPATTITYHHDFHPDPGALTGKSFNGVRYSTFAYGTQGRAISTQHAGGVNHYTFSYAVEASEQLPVPPAPPAPGGLTESTSATTQTRPTRFRVTETNPLGRKTTHLYEDGRKVSVTGDASPNCAASYRELTYDANGYPDIVGDFTDRLTDFDHDAHGHLLKKVEAVGTPLARTTTQEWDDAANRLVRVTIEGDRETRYTWMPNGRLASEAVTDLSGKGTTAATTYRYTEHANGLLATMAIDGPLVEDTETTTWSTSGDLLSVRNAVGHVTAYTQHNGLGLPGRITGPNGEITELAYDARGRIVAETRHVEGTPQTTHYAYDGAGLLASVQAPDGRLRRFVHDAAHRLVEEYEREPDGLYSRKRTTYNAMSQPTTVEVHRTPYPHDTRIHGHVEGVFVTAPGHFEARGWACTTGQDAHVDVDLYAGGPSPAGNFLGRHAASRTSEPAVAIACGAQGAAYRFAIPIHDATRTAHGGKPLYVHGMSPAGKENAVLVGSGMHAIPQFAYNAEIVAHDTPTQMLAEQTATITVTVRNTGNVTWKAGTVYLGRNQGHYAMPAAGVPLGADVVPGESASFGYSFRAPPGPTSPMAVHWFGGQMAANGVGFFGPLVPVKSVLVETPSGSCSGSQCENPR